MNRLILFIFLSLSFLVAKAQTAVQFIDVLNSQPIACGGVSTFYWSNPWGTTVKVKQTRQWVGIDDGLQADIDVATWVTDASGNTGSMLARQQLDAYAGRSFEQERWHSFAPDFIVIPPGGGAKMQVFCNPIFGGTNVQALFSIIFE